jgi:hypothetical protein
MNFSWHDYLLMASFLAAIAGITLLKTDKHPAKDEVEAADQMLILMSFTYFCTTKSHFTQLGNGDAEHQINRSNCLPVNGQLCAQSAIKPGFCPPA